MHTFSKTASRLSRNPLGVLALFLVLVYGFACLVVGLGVETLNPQERLPLIWFLVLFPVIVLGVFYRLVTQHHRKLYAPGDYKNEQLFIAPLSGEVVEQKIEQEIEAVVSQQSTVAERTVSSTTPQVSTQDLRSSYLDAEKLAFRALEEDLGFPIRQQVSMKGSHYDFGFDGLASIRKALHFFEVKYFRSPNFKREFIEAALHRVASIAFSPTFWDSGKYDDIVFHLVVVVEFSRKEIDNFEKKLRSQIHSELFAVQYHFYILDDLRKRFEKKANQPLKN